LGALVIRNIPDAVHNALRRIAADRHVSVEALVRDSLVVMARQGPPGGIDFQKLERDRVALGLETDAPNWTEAMDDPALSRRVLGVTDK
jgi:plasmid stability protein